MQHQIILALRIWDFADITHEQITQELQYNPTKIYVMGQPRSAISTALVKTNGWILELSTDKQQPFELQMKKLLEWLLSRKNQIYQYSLRYRCEISCALFLYFENGESIPSVHLDIPTIQQLNEIGLPLDFDIYCLPDA